MDVHPPKNGMYRYWSIAISLNIMDEYHGLIGSLNKNIKKWDFHRNHIHIIISYPGVPLYSSSYPGHYIGPRWSPVPDGPPRWFLEDFTCFHLSHRFAGTWHPGPMGTHGDPHRDPRGPIGNPCRIWGEWAAENEIWDNWWQLYIAKWVYAKFKYLNQFEVQALRARFCGWSASTCEFRSAHGGLLKIIPKMGRLSTQLGPQANVQRSRQGGA